MGFFANLIKENHNSSNTKSNSLEATLTKCKRYKIDNFIMFTSNTCKHCSKYGRTRNGKGKVYSISGKSKKYPSMMTIPSDLVIGRCPECNKFISFSPYFDEINT